MLEILMYFAIAIISVAALLIVGFAFFSRNFFKIIFINALLGIASLFIIRAISSFTGVSLAVNPWTLTSASAFGMPAVCGMLMLNLIF